MTEERKNELLTRVKYLKKEEQKASASFKRKVKNAKTVLKRLEKARADEQAAWHKLNTTKVDLNRIETKLKFCSCDCEQCMASTWMYDCCAPCSNRWSEATKHRKGCKCINCDNSQAHP